MGLPPIDPSLATLLALDALDLVADILLLALALLVLARVALLPATVEVLPRGWIAKDVLSSWP